jgi:hypothetical protein
MKILRKAAHNLASNCFSEVAKFHLPNFGGLALGCIEADFLQLHIRFAAFGENVCDIVEIMIPREVCRSS